MERWSRWSCGSAVSSSYYTDSPDYSDPDDATAASSGWTSNHNPGQFTKQTADAKAFLTGEVRWYNGDPRFYLHRGGLSGVRLIAEADVGCIWAQVKWGYPTGSISFPGPGLTVAPAETVGGLYVKCRSGSATRPAAIDLSGIADARAFLNSVTITIGTSATKSDGARNTASEKESYGSPTYY